MLVGGKPDVSLVPMLSLARAYRRTLKRHGPEVLGYGDPRGHERLRTAIAQMLARRAGSRSDRSRC
jgi:GntR family transcriptional regulator/MocR family aminotransferase